jgi:hypothetical protein
MSFAGYVQLDATFRGVLLTKLDGAMTDADALPTYRIYAPSGVAIASGSCSYLKSGSISTVENTTPIRVNFTANHGLQTGERINPSGVTGAVAATVNGLSFLVTVIDPDTVELQSTTAAGTGTGGSWHLTGQYTMSQAVTEANTFEVNETYTVIYAALISGEPTSDVDTFSVV